MKKVLGVIIAFLALFLLPIQAFAVDYSIENMQIEVLLQENGDAHVTETQTYDFKSSFNGISRMLIPKEGTSIVDFEAVENDSTLKVEQEDHLYKMYRSGKNETITVTTTYTIENGVEVYADAAQFYWPFIDYHNESEYKNLDIVVHPPQVTTDALAIGYEEAEDTERIQSDGIVHFSLGKVPSGEGVEIRVAYDQSLFPGATLTGNRPIRDEILAEQKKREDQKVVFEQRKHTLNDFAPYILGFYGVLLLALLLYARQKRQMTLADVERRYTPPYFVPEETMSLPATIIYTGRVMFIPVEVLTVALLDLVRKNVVKQIDEETFQVIHRNTDYDHEAHLLDWLFYKVGHDSIFNVNDLKDYTNNPDHASQYQSDYQTWQKLVRDEVKENQLFESHKFLRISVSVISVLLLPLIIMFGVHDLFAIMSISIGLFILLISFVVFYHPRTAQGAKIKKEWDDFREKYVQFEEKEWSELQDDEQRRAFLYGIGVNDQQIKDKNEWLLNHEPQIVYADPNPMFFLLFATMANSHFNDAHTSSATTGSSTGTGFTGGGGGVGGGGGGSGAF